MFKIGIITILLTYLQKQIVHFKKNVKLIAHHASKIEFTENSMHIVYN